MTDRKYTALSSRGYNMLRYFVTEVSKDHVSIDEAQHLDQRPFRSMLIRKWIAYTPGKGFHATKEGRDAWRSYETQSILRSEGLFLRPLTSYFDANAYGLKPQREKKEPARASNVREFVKRRHVA
jgi:hypothetical protein